MYHQQRVAQSWSESQEECQAGGGHLTRLLKVVLVEILKSIVASLTNREEEEQVLDSVPATDVWTGGNLCSDSPAPLHSMWTDGSENEETHFARWKKCKTRCYAICQGVWPGGRPLLCQGREERLEGGTLLSAPLWGGQIFSEVVL